ncbi:MAG TPA: AI-2E family transporter [Methylococcus sp.]|nr:AI-2E family transporter [Methylococcus sp.]
MSASERWFLLVSLAVAGGLVYLLAPILMPFAAAAILAYLADPLADRLEARGLGRTTAVILVFCGLIVLFAGFLLLLVPILEHQITRLVDDLPVYIRWIKSAVLPWLQKRLGVSTSLTNLDQIARILSGHWQQAGGVAAYVLSSLTHSGAVLLSWLMNLILIPVVTFYLLRDWDALVAKVHDLLPRRYADTAARLARESDAVLSAFFRGQLAVMAALGAVYSIGLWLIGVELAFLIGLGAGLLSFIPYAGFLLGATSAAIASVVQTGDVWSVLPVLAVFGFGQALEGIVLTPWLVGDRIGLHPVAVLFSILAGGQLFGFLGVLLALPVASVVMVLLRHAHDLYRESGFYGSGKGTAGNGPVKSEEGEAGSAGTSEVSNRTP